MRAMVISDTHGNFPEHIVLLNRFDAVVHCGDFFPDTIYFGDPGLIAKVQLNWLEKNLDKLKNVLSGRPYIYTLGNHDFVPSHKVEEMLKSVGIKAFDCEDKIVTVDNVNFYGFPYVPSINGMFNYECEVPEMNRHIDIMAEKLNKTYVEVIVAHAPMYQCLDYEGTGKSYGNQSMNNFFDYKIAKEMTPAYYLSGHIHRSAGISIRNGVGIVNAATTQIIVEI